MSDHQRRRAPTLRRALVAVAMLGVVGVSFGLVLPMLAPYAAVWREVRDVPTPWRVALLGSIVLNLCTFALPWMIALPGLGFVRALLVTQASTAFTLVAPGGAPAGMAVSYAGLRKSGFAASDVAPAVALTGLWNQLSTFVFPGLAFAVLAAGGARNGAVATVALVGAVLFVGAALVLGAALANERLAHRAGDRAGVVLARLAALLGRAPTRLRGDAVVGFRRDALGLLRRSWHALTVATLANQLTGYLILVASLLAVGVGRAQVGIGESFAAWSAGRLLSSIPVTPGGIGYTEVGLTGLLIAFGGQRSPVVAAVLVYRACSILPTLAVGALAAVSLTRRASRS